jgi:hypothetical protein
MPDANKLKAMAAAGYAIADSCVTCKWHGGLPLFQWGECDHKDAKYQHAKQGEKKLPCHRAFICDNHERASWVEECLGAYAEQPWRDQ